MESILENSELKQWINDNLNMIEVYDEYCRIKKEILRLQKKKIYMKQYYEKNKDRLKEYSGKYYNENKDRILKKII
jgi:hypothetical protein